MATQKIKFQSPFGTAQYPHISSPDTKGKYADNKFKTKLEMPAGDPAVQKFVQAIKDAATAIHGPKGLKMYMPFTEDEDNNTIIFSCKTMYAPAVFDGKGNPVKGKTIGGGSVLRVSGQFIEFDKGIAAQFNQVQIKELNGFGSCGFGKIEDGYEFDGPDEDNSTSSFNDTNDDGAGSNSALDI